MIGVGATLVSQFSVGSLYILAFLIFTGIKMWLSVDKEYEVGNLLF
jgi:tellurite resistance protein TerC